MTDHYVTDLRSSDTRSRSGCDGRRTSQSSRRASMPALSRWRPFSACRPVTAPACRKRPTGWLGFALRSHLQSAARTCQRKGLSNASMHVRRPLSAGQVQVLTPSIPTGDAEGESGALRARTMPGSCEDAWLHAMSWHAAAGQDKTPQHRSMASLHNPGMRRQSRKKGLQQEARALVDGAVVRAGEERCRVARAVQRGDVAGVRRPHALRARGLARLDRGGVVDRERRAKRGADARGQRGRRAVQRHHLSQASMHLSVKITA